MVTVLSFVSLLAIQICCGVCASNVFRYWHMMHRISIVACASVVFRSWCLVLSALNRSGSEGLNCVWLLVSIEICFVAGVSKGLAIFELDFK